MRERDLPVSLIDDALAAQRAAATAEINAELDRQLSETNAQIAQSRKDFMSLAVVALGLGAVVGGYLMKK